MISSYDVVFAIDSERLLKRFNQFDANVLFSAEAFCWPDPALEVSLAVLVSSKIVI